MSDDETESVHDNEAIMEDVDHDSQNVNAADKNQVYTPVATEKLLNTYFQLPDDKLAAIYAHLESEGAYANGHWLHLSVNENDEPPLHDAFVGLANMINDFVKAQNWIQGDQIKGTWLVCPLVEGQSPISSPPGCVFAENSRVEDAEGNPVNPEWLTVLSHVGIRYENTPEAWERAFLKMYHQAHYMLLNQKERQAVIGLVLCLDVLNVFIMDKDGVIGLSNPIEVHQDPINFIHVLAGMSLLPRSSLGFRRDTGKKKADTSIYPFEKFVVEVKKNPNVDTPKRSAKISKTRAISRFKNLRELLEGFKDVLELHKTAYENGILHSRVNKDSIRLRDQTITVDFE